MNIGLQVLLIDMLEIFKKIILKDQEIRGNQKTTLESKMMRIIVAMI